MITLDKDRLEFYFPDVHEHARFSIEFQRTLRIPDDDTAYPLPPSLGKFPLRHMTDIATHMSESEAQRGGIIFPMYQAEAMWINFHASHGDGVPYPFAVKIATGKINAVSGEPWSSSLNTEPQDYVVLPEQPWLDGYNVKKGLIRQFVAMPLGAGYSAEEQVTAKAEFGGLQIMAIPMKRERYEALLAQSSERYGHDSRVMFSMEPSPQSSSMGLAPGGMMRQEIFDDPYGLEVWDQRHSDRCFVTIANTKRWLDLTGEAPPTKMPTAADYSRKGLPWFDYYDENAIPLRGSDILGGLKSVSATGKLKGQNPLPENEGAKVSWIRRLGRLSREQDL